MIEFFLAIVLFGVVGWVLISPFLYFSMGREVEAFSKRIDKLNRRINALATTVDKQSTSTQETTREPTTEEKPQITHPASASTRPDLRELTRPPEPDKVATNSDAESAETHRLAKTPTSPAPSTWPPGWHSKSEKPAKPKQSHSPAARIPDEELSSEERFASTWMTWIGAIAFVIGAGFFYRYAIDQGWISPLNRILTGLAVGIGGMLGGVYAMRRDYDRLAPALVGSGLGVLYFTFFAAVKIFSPPIMSLELAFIGMILSTAAAITFAVRYDSEVTAILGTIGGFLTPIMLSQGVDGRWVLFPWLMILDVGLLFAATYRHWPKVNLLAFTGTVFMWFGWFLKFYELDKRGDVVLLLTPFAIIFTLLSVWHHLIKRSKPKELDFPIIFATPVLYLAAMLGILGEYYSDYAGLVTAGMGAVLLALAVVSRLRNAHGSITSVWGAMGSLFVFLAVPMQFHAHWILVVWVVQALILFEVGKRHQLHRLTNSGYVVLGIVIACLAGMSLESLAFPAFYRPMFETRNLLIHREFRAAGALHEWQPFLSARFITAVITIGVVTVMAWRCRRHEEVDEKSRSALVKTAASLVLMTLLSETHDIWWHVSNFMPSLIAALAIEFALLGLLLRIAANFGRVAILGRVGQFCFSLCGLALTVQLLMTFGMSSSEWIAITQHGSTGDWWSCVLLNPRGLGYAISILCVCMSGSIWHSLRERPSRKESNSVFQSLSEATPVAFATLFVFFAGFMYLTTEIRVFGTLQHWETGTSLAYTLGWTAYALATIGVGIFTRSSDLRILALSLFGLTTVKVFLGDIWQLGTTIRFIAFMGLGVTLMLVSWLYRRYQDRIREWIKAEENAMSIPEVGQ